MKHYPVYVVLGAVALLAALSVLGYVSPEAAHGTGLIGAMAVVQSAYNEHQPVGTAGMIASTHQSDVDTRVCETVAGIGFGLAVGKGSGDNGAILGGAANTFLGLTVRDVTLMNDTVDKYAQYQNMGVMTKGKMWVVPEADVTDGDNVVYDTATGRLSSVAADGTHILIAGARWEKTATAGNLSIVRLSGTVGAA